jgi:hypothetical protein
MDIQVKTDAICVASPKVTKVNKKQNLQPLPQVFLVKTSTMYPSFYNIKAWNAKGGSIHLLFDWFGLVCFANKNKNCQLSYS